MKTQSQHACSEYNAMSRRTFMKKSAVGAVALSSQLAWVPQVAYANSFASNRDIVISVYLRGGADGLTLCVPHGEARYYQLRPDIAVPPPSSGNPKRAKDLDGFFGLAYGFYPLEAAYRAGHLAFIHAVGSDSWSRSHFDAQRWMENCGRDINLNTGWLGRHLLTSSEMVAGSPLRGLAMTYGMVRTLNGAPKALPIPDVDNFAYGSYLPDFGLINQTVTNNYIASNDATRASVENTERTIQLLASLDIGNYHGAGGAVYDENEFGYQMKSSAALIKANLGVEAIHIDVQGWDTHNQQGSVDGYMEQLMLTVGRNLAAFHQDMNASGRMDFTLVVLSEFGRNAAQNNTIGTDHGAGSSMIVMGGAVNGNKVYGQWPGLTNLLDNQDLYATTDYRSILAEVVSKRLQNGANLGTIFPDFTPNYLNILS